MRRAPDGHPIGTTAVRLRVEVQSHVRVNVQRLRSLPHPPAHADPCRGVETERGLGIQDRAQPISDLRGFHFLEAQAQIVGGVPRNCPKR